LIAAALRHTIAVGCANGGAASGGSAAAGRSALWSEQGDCVAQLPAAGAGLAIARQTSGRWSATTRSL
jgi:hypothetical protein